MNRGNSDNKSNSNGNSNGNNDDMIKKAAKHLGKSPEELKAAMNKLNPKQTEQLNRALNDEKYAKKLLSSPQALALIKLLMGK